MIISDYLQLIRRGFPPPGSVDNCILCLFAEAIVLLPFAVEEELLVRNRKKLVLAFNKVLHVRLVVVFEGLPGSSREALPQADAKRMLD